MSMLNRSLAISCCFLYLLTPAARAEDSAAQSGGSGSTELSEITVTAQRRTERLRDVPITVTVQTADDLDKAGVTETRDLTAVVPGLLFIGQGAWLQPNLRGVSTTITGADNPIALYLDGVYQPSQNGQVFDLPDVTRIEVLKGPQGTLFGRNATGGAIQVFTENPSFTASGHVSASAGDYFGGTARSSGDYAGSLFVTGPLVGQTVAGSLSASVHETAGYLTDIVDGRRWGSIDSKMVRGKLLFAVSDSANITATAFWMHRNDYETEAGLPLNGVTTASQWQGSIYARQPWTTAFDSPLPQYSAEMHGASIKAEFDMAAGTLTSITAYSKLAAAENVDVDIAYSPPCLAAFGCISYQVTTPQETESTELNFASKKFFDRVAFTSGLFAYIDRGGTTGNINSGALGFGTAVHTHAYAAYSEANFNITDKLVAIAGLRYSWEGKTATGSFDPAPRTKFIDVTYNSVTPRFSLRYELTDATNVYFTYSEGFKSGVTPTNVYTAPATKPEKIKAYELGAKIGAQNYILNSAVFYYDYRNKQEQFFNGVVSFPANAATAEIYGFETDGTWHMSEQFQTRLGVSWLPEAEYKKYNTGIAFSYPIGPFGLTQYPNYNADGIRLNTTPKVTGSFSGTYSQPVGQGKLQATGSIYYSSAYQFEITGRVKQGSYATLSGELAYAPASEKWKLAVFGKNLTNRAYINSALLDGNADMVSYAPPRLVGMKMDYNF